jgi:hypothetical protein
MAAEWHEAKYVSDCFPVGALIYYDPLDPRNTPTSIEGAGGYVPWVEGAVYEADEYSREEASQMMSHFPGFFPFDPEKIFWVATGCG